MNMTAEQKELLLKWVAALRSGKYPQTRLKLKDHEGYCCLGVLCDVVNPEGWLSHDSRGFDFSYQESVALPSTFIQTLLPKFVYANIAKFVRMNDFEGKSFVEIANYIESLYETN